MYAYKMHICTTLLHQQHRGCHTGQISHIYESVKHAHENYTWKFDYTALDPALPLFISAPPTDKLDPTDADFVDVYHSNAFVQGQIERCGTVDFYMNGGIGKFTKLF